MPKNLTAEGKLGLVIEIQSKIDPTTGNMKAGRWRELSDDITLK